MELRDIAVEMKAEVSECSVRNPDAGYITVGEETDTTESVVDDGRENDGDTFGVLGSDHQARILDLDAEFPPVQKSIVGADGREKNSELNHVPAAEAHNNHKRGREEECSKSKTATICHDRRCLYMAVAAALFALALTLGLALGLTLGQEGPLPPASYSTYSSCEDLDSAQAKAVRDSYTYYRSPWSEEPKQYGCCDRVPCEWWTLHYAHGFRSHG